MTIYFLAVILGAILQLGVIYLLRASFFPAFWYTIPLILVYQFLFLWAYSKSPKFLIIWFTATALTNLLAFLLGWAVWGERIGVTQGIAIVLIVTGVFLLRA